MNTTKELMVFMTKFVVNMLEKKKERKKENEVMFHRGCSKTISSWICYSKIQKFDGMRDNTCEHIVRSLISWDRANGPNLSSIEF